MQNINLERGVGETDESYSGRLDEYISKLRWQSEGHRNWYTHKNPYGCWICELLQVCEQYRDIYLDATKAERGLTDTRDPTERLAEYPNIDGDL